MSAGQSNYCQEDRNEPIALTKKPPNAYLIFQRAIGRDVRSHLKPNVVDWKKIVSEKWRGLEETERAPFREEAARLLEFHKVNNKLKRKGKRNKKVTKPAIVHGSSEAATLPGPEFQNAVRSQGTEVHRRQNPEVNPSAYREIKWERVQVGRLHSPVTRHHEVPPPVPVQMYHVFQSNTGEKSSEPLDGMQDHSSSSTSSRNALPVERSAANGSPPPLIRTDDVQDPSHSPAAFGCSQSLPFRHLTSPSPSPVAFSERSMSIWSTPSSSFLPTPSSSIFDTALPQVPTPWTSQDSNHYPYSALDIDLGFTHEELVTSSQDISEYSSECPPKLDIRDMAGDSSSFMSPIVSPFWTGPMLSSSDAGQLSPPPADTAFGVSSLDPDAGSRLLTQASLEELLRGDGSSLDCSAGLGLSFEPSVGLAELIGTDLFLSP